MESLSISENVIFELTLEPAVLAAVEGDTVRAEAEVIKSAGELLGLQHTTASDYAGAHLMEGYARAMHENFGEGAASASALDTLERIVDKIRPYEGQVAQAVANGTVQLEDPIAQKLLDHAHEAIRQTRLAQEVLQNVDIDLAAPVLNCMQRLGGARTLDEACTEMAKLGPASDVTYGKAATDMARLLTGQTLEAYRAADVLDNVAAGAVTPQFGIQATASMPPTSLVERAERGDLAAQYALMGACSLLFDDENEAAHERLEAIVTAELSQQRNPPDWKSMDEALGHSNLQLADDSQARRNTQDARNSSRTSPSRELER